MHPPTHSTAERMLKIATTLTLALSLATNLIFSCYGYVNMHLKYARYPTRNAFATDRHQQKMQIPWIVKSQPRFSVSDLKIGLDDDLPLSLLSSSSSESEANNQIIVPDPSVTLKMAFDSSDEWAVADMSETKSERFTSPESLDMVHRLRRCSDCVLVGKSTVERDNCTLTVRRVNLIEGRKQPIRVVIDPSLSLLVGEKEDGKHFTTLTRYAMFHDGLPAFIFYDGRLVDEGVIGRFPDGTSSVSSAVEFVDLSSLDFEVTKEQQWIKKVTTIEVDRTPHRYIPPKIILDYLSTRGINHVMIEGGPMTAMGFLLGGLVDRALLIRAPVKFQIPVLSGMDDDIMKAAGLIKLERLDTGDGDVVECWSKSDLPWPTENVRSWP